MGDLDWTAFRRSVSQRGAYRQCGRKWYLRYGQGWVPVQTPAYFAIGHVWQDVVNAVLLAERAPANWSPMIVKAGFNFDRVPLSGARDHFLKLWAPYEHDATIRWNRTMGWAAYRDRYVFLCEKKLREIPERMGIDAHTLLDAPLAFNLGGVEETGYPDYVGPQQHPDWDRTYWTITDFKTASRRWDPLKVETHEQATDYQIGVNQLREQHPALNLPAPERICFCVAVHTSTPDLQWLWTPVRSSAAVNEHIMGAVQVDAQIRAGHFGCNYAMCDYMGGCEFKPLCFESLRATAREVLKQDDPKKIRDGAGVELDFLGE